MFHAINRYKSEILKQDIRHFPIKQERALVAVAGPPFFCLRSATSFALHQKEEDGDKGK